jgi:flagellar hook-length control protein FliK
MQERFAPFAILVRALLWPTAEELRIGIVADIATVTSMTKAAVSNGPANLTAGANVPGSFDALFGVLLQQTVQPATPADGSGQPVASNDITNPQADPVPQPDPQAFRQTPQDASPLIGLLQNAVPQQPIHTCTYTGTVPNQPANGAAFLLQQSQTAQSDGATLVMAPPSGPAPDAAAKNDPTSAADAVPQSSDAAAANAMTAALTADAKPATHAAPQKSAKPAAKDDQRKTADTADPRNTPDANLVTALTQQMQAIAIQPPSSAGNAASVMETVAASPQPAMPVSDAQPSPTRAQAQSVADGAANSANAASGDTKQAAGADDRGAPKVDAKANKASPPSSGAREAAPAPDAPSSVSGQSAGTTPSVAATAIQAQVQTVNAASFSVNLQVAPQHHTADPASTPTLDLLGVTIAAKSADGVKHFDIRLDPPELGRVEVHLSLDDSGKAQASLVVDKPQTLELLQRDAANLTRTLNDAGVSLSNNGLNFSLRGQDRQDVGGSVVKGRGRALSVKAVMGTDTISNSGSIASLAPDSVRLDIRV